MDIKELRKSTQMSQSQFAKKTGIPVRTLQQWEQNRSSPPKYVFDFINSKLDLQVRKYTIPDPKEYKICIQKPFKNCQKIYPIQQKKVRALLDELEQNKNVNKVIIFGSSVTNRCHIGSDIDIYVDLNKNSNPLTRQYDFEYDLWNNFTVDERLKNEINKKGVVVYG